MNSITCKSFQYNIFGHHLILKEMKRKIFNVRHYLGAICFVFIAAGFISCEKNIIDPPKIDPNVQLSFQNDIKPILTAKCSSCHGTKFSTYSTLESGSYFNTTSPESSTLYVKIISSGHTARTTDAEKQKILIWIQQGAKNN